MAQNKGKIVDKIGTAFIVLIQAVPAAVYFLFIQIYGTELLNLPLTFKETEAEHGYCPCFRGATKYILLRYVA